MLKLNSPDEAALHALIEEPEAAVEATREVREAARRIRAFFVRDRGWSVARLRRWRFRDLAALTQPGEVKLCRTQSREAWSAKQDDLTLELSLNELGAQLPSQRERALRRLTGAEQVAEVLLEKTLALPEKDWAYLQKLVSERYGQIDTRQRKAGAELAGGVVKLLEAAYGR